MTCEMSEPFWFAGDGSLGVESWFVVFMRMNIEAANLQMMDETLSCCTSFVQILRMGWLLTVMVFVVFICF